MAKGRMVKVLDRAEATEETVMNHSLQTVKG
jgi:hypothetical protein